MKASEEEPIGLRNVNAQLLTALVTHLNRSEQTLLQFITGTLDIIAQAPDQRVLVYESGAIEGLLKTLLHPEPTIVKNSLSTLKNLVSFGIFTF